MRPRSRNRQPSATPIRGRETEKAQVTVIAATGGKTHLLTMTADVAHEESVSAQLAALDPGVWRGGGYRLVAETTGQVLPDEVDGYIADDLRAAIGYLRAEHDVDVEILPDGALERLGSLLAALEGES